MTLSAGIVPIRLEPQTEYLLLRVYRYWDFPKGVVEVGENPLAAAVRELQEETGLEPASFPWGQEFIETEPYARGKIARYYVALASSFEVTLGWEHMEHRWLPFAAARKLLVPRLQAVLDWANTRVGA